MPGSASGIGGAAALRLARAGYDVAINYRRSGDSARRTLAELERLGGHHLALRGDVSDDAAVTAMVAAVGDAYGRLDALVNNAGMTSSTPPDDLDGVDLAEWDRVFAVNVRGLFQVTRACADRLRAARITAFPQASLSTLPAAGQVGVLGLGGWLVSQGRVSLGTFVAFAGYLAMLAGPARLLAAILI